MALSVPSSATNGTGHTTNGMQVSINSSKPIILHLGDPIRYNQDLYEDLKSRFHIERPPVSDLHRPQFIQHLREKTWGNFSAIMRPFWNTGGEMQSWNEELIDLLPGSLKVIASAGAGFDWVDTKALGEHGILYTNGAGASTESVADVALLLIISVFRQIPWSSQAARSGIPTEFQKAHRLTMFSSHNPRNHTLGIVGLGNIGFAIAKKVHLALGMEILYFDIDRKSAAQESEVGAIFYPSLDSLLQNSDCLLLASPGGPTILDARRLALLKPGSRIVNVARGSLIDEDALADALDNGHISAAGLDVFQNEPNIHPRLNGRSDVMATCHTAGGSVDTIKGFERLVLENIDAVLNGREPLTAVNTKDMRENPSNHVNGHVYHSPLNGEGVSINGGDHQLHPST